MSFTRRLLVFFLFIVSISCTKNSGNSQKPAYDSARKYILCFGDSLTRGSGIPDSSNYPSLLQKKLIDNGYPYEVVNLGVNGETTAAGKERLSSILQKYPANEIALFVLALSGNDGFRSVPVNQTKANLNEILLSLKEKEIPRLLVGLKFIDLKLFGRDRFEGLFEELSNTTETPLVADMLDGVRLKSQYNLSDGIHPNEQGTKLVFKNLWAEIEKQLPHPNDSL